MTLDSNPRTPASEETGRRPRPVMGPGLRRLLLPVLGLFAFLAVNGLYLAAVTWLEWWSGARYQDYFYQLMFLAHLSLGLLLVLPFVLFGALHLRNARRRPNRPAVTTDSCACSTARRWPSMWSASTAAFAGPPLPGRS